MKRRVQRLETLGALSMLCAALASVPRQTAAQAVSEDNRVTRRYVLLVGANDGGPDRAALRYAVSDARSLQRVMQQLGGVDARDVELLQQPDAARLEAAFGRIRAEVDAARTRGQRSELVFYYSGHSDEAGLRLGGQMLGYRQLRTLIDSVPADVRIGVLDSCASGVLTRLKGGTARPPFLVDRSTDVRGHAFLTSSSESEAAQESDRIRGSFFTHYLVSGLRGAADANADGRITLNEAYRFAFDETLARTEATQGGAQHAAFDIQLAGTGDVVMTDLASTSASLTFVREVQGRLFIRGEGGRLVAELNKPAGRAVAIGLPAGKYQVRVEHEGQLTEAQVTLADASSTALAPDALTPVAREASRARGGPRDDAGDEHDDLSEREYRVIPFSIALFHPIDSNIVEDHHKVVNQASINLLYGRAARTEGMALGIGVNYLSEDLRGMQMTVGANLAGGRADGMQLAVGLNLAGGAVDGAQLAAGANITGASVLGLQAAAGANLAHSELVGAQLAAGFNYADAVNGLQMSSGASAARDITGAQLSSVNYAYLMHGLQLGLVNIASSRARGLQLGLVNIAGDADAQLGLLSISEQGGIWLQGWTSDTALVNLAVRLDARHTYGFLATGLHPLGDDDGYSLGLGIGVKGDLGADLHLELDSALYSVQYGYDGTPFDDSQSLLAQARLSLRIDLAGRLSAFAGPSFNLLIARDERDFGRRFGYGYTLERNEGAQHELSMWPGFVLGVQI